MKIYAIMPSIIRCYYFVEVNHMQARQHEVQRFERLRFPMETCDSQAPAEQKSLNRST
jgi:hypothetical protein